MLFADGVIGTVNRILHIADHGIDPGEGLQGNAGGTAAGYDRLVATASVLDTAETAQPIGNDYACRMQVPLRPLRDLFLADAFYSGYSSINAPFRRPAKYPPVVRQPSTCLRRDIGRNPSLWRREMVRRRRRFGTDSDGQAERCRAAPIQVAAARRSEG